MKKMKTLLISLGIIVSLVACGNKNSVENLKKDSNLLKETLTKCEKGELKAENEACINGKKAQEELAKEDWEKVKKEVAEKVEKVSSVGKTKKFDDALILMPPKIMENLAKKAGLSSTDEFKKQMEQFLNVAFSEVEIVEVKNDIDGAKVGRTSVGRTYAIIETEVTVSMAGQQIKQPGKTLVFKDGENWYGINYDPQYLPSAIEIYPDLAEIK